MATEQTVTCLADIVETKKERLKVFCLYFNYVIGVGIVGFVISAIIPPAQLGFMLVIPTIVRTKHTKLFTVVMGIIAITAVTLVSALYAQPSDFPQTWLAIVGQQFLHSPLFWFGYIVLQITLYILGLALDKSLSVNDA